MMERWIVGQVVVDDAAGSRQVSMAGGRRGE